jgi:phage shock protein A
MGVAKRLARLIRATTNHLLDRAEHPERLLEQVIRDMEAELATARLQTRNMIAQEKELQAELAAAESATKTWAGKAETAVAAGRDDLARLALRRKRDSAEITRVYQEQLDAQRAAVTRLKDQLRQIESQYQSARSRKDVMVARHRRARATESVFQHQSLDTAAQELDRAGRKIRAAEARAAATEEMATGSLDAQFLALEDPELERELRDIKARLAGSDATLDDSPALSDQDDELDVLPDRPSRHALPSGN